MVGWGRYGRRMAKPGKREGDVRGKGRIDGVQERPGRERGAFAGGQAILGRTPGDEEV